MNVLSYLFFPSPSPPSHFRKDSAAQNASSWLEIPSEEAHKSLIMNLATLLFVSQELQRNQIAHVPPPPKYRENLLLFVPC